MKKDHVIIFTDGASRGNPGPGGWGAVVVLPDKKVIEIGGRENETTNNRMELTAVLQALLVVQSNNLTIYLDSSYVLNGITKWVKGWKKNGWKTSTKQKVLNQDLWEELHDLVEVKKENIQWELVSGHSGVLGNERCDEIATAFADGRKIDLYTGPLSTYPIDILNVEQNKIKKEAKTKDRSRSKIKAYSYLSLLDGKLIRHTSWEECERRVKGKNAKFKKAISAEDEKVIMASWGIKSFER